MASPSTKKLLQLFERELRDLDSRVTDIAPRKRAVRISRELDQQVVAFASEVRTHGSTPEQMLVDLKSMLSQAAPDIPTAQRNVLVAELTGRAIDAFFSRQQSDGRH